MTTPDQTPPPWGLDKILRADGRAQFIQPAGPLYVFKDLQGWVGGYIRLVRVPDRPDLVLVVDEDGIPKELPPNRDASLVALQTLLGDAILMRRDRFPTGDP